MDDPKGNPELISRAFPIIFVMVSLSDLKFESWFDTN